jgi:hypothetical protein
MWSPYGTVHGIHMQQSMESICNSPWNPYATVHGIHMQQFIKSIIPLFYYSPWIPYGTIHMDSIVIPYQSIVKLLILVILVEFEN